MLMVPLDEPVVPPSWMAIQLPSAWMSLTLVAFAGTTEEPLEALLVAPAVTLMETSVTQTAPLPFHTLTCSVCAPPGAATGPSM